MRMKNKSFIDSNIFIYLYDDKYPERQAHSRSLIRELKNNIVISSQVLKEVSSVLLKKFDLPIETVKSFIYVSEKYEVVDTPAPVIRHALDLMLSHSVSFWDALIIATAQSAYCNRIYTEDLQHGQKFSGLEIVNPFKGD